MTEALAVTLLIDLTGAITTIDFMLYGVGDRGSPCSQINFLTKREIIPPSRNASAGGPNFIESVLTLATFVWLG